MKQAYRISMGATLGLFLMAMGCGSTGAESLFSSGGTTSSGNGGATGSSGSGQTSSSSSSTGTGGTTGTGGMAGTGGAIGTGGMAGTGGAIGTGGMAGTGGATGTGGGGPVAVIPCGDNLDCPYGGNNACCWNSQQNKPPPYNTCVDATPDMDGCRTFASTNGGYETRIECASGSQCAQGEMCCAHRGQSNTTFFYDEVTCQTTCDFPTNRILCDPNGPDICPTVPTGGGQMTKLTCKPSQFLPPGYFVCTT